MSAPRIAAVRFFRANVDHEFKRSLHSRECGENLAYFGVEFAVAVAIGSVSLFADSIDFLEDTSLIARAEHREANAVP